MITQDLVKGIDLTGLTSLSGSEMNQLVDVGRAATDKGMAIETTDTSLGVADPPNPNVAISGITPIWWKRYVWVRKKFSGDTESPYAYVWDENKTPDSLLNWQRVDFEVLKAQSDATLAFGAAGTSAQLATDAQTAANNAQTDATQALSDAATAQATADGAAAAAAGALLGLNFYVPGDVKPTIAATIFSKIINQQWLEADGSDVAQAVFPELFTAIGATYGTAGNPSTDFKLPDFRGRALIGQGAGATLTPRLRGEQTIGVETHTLIQAELPAVGLAINADTEPEENLNEYNSPNANNCLSPAGTAGTIGPYPMMTENMGSDSPHENMQPSAVVRWLIKT